MSDFREEEKLGKLYDSQITRRLMQYLRPYRLQVVLAVSFTLAITAVEILGPFLFSVGIDRYIIPGFDRSIPRTAEAQFRHSRRESRSAAWGGDLVFFHVDSDPDSYVYHVAIYEGDNHIVSATDPSEGIAWQRIWDSDVTFGTITH